MKRILLFAIALAVLIAGCGSGGSTTSATTPTRAAAPKKHKKHKKTKVVVKKTRVVHKKTTSSSSGGNAVTTTAATTAVTTTTTSAPPPPPPTTHTTHTTHTTTHVVVPTTTHQTATHHHHHNGGGGHGSYCLSVTDRIDTPRGAVPVAQVQPGMRVWSTDSSGRRISVKVLRVHHTAVPAFHLMVRLRLADGRQVLASLGHPLPGGQAIKTLAVGQRFEGTRVVSDTRVRYGHAYTYDLLPAGPTQTYFANRVLLGSTLAPAFGSHRLSRPF
jgi:hypothetical protein